MPIVDRLLAGAPRNLPLRLGATSAPSRIRGDSGAVSATQPHFSCDVSLAVVEESVLAVP